VQRLGIFEGGGVIAKARIESHQRFVLLNALVRLVELNQTAREPVQSAGVVPSLIQRPSIDENGLAESPLLL
jgi:hypothetical protein